MKCKLFQSEISYIRRQKTSDSRQRMKVQLLMSLQQNKLALQVQTSPHNKISIHTNLAGVQTGRDSIITKAKISPPRESLNLSDLSDEEVDRLTQLGLSFGPSKVTGQRLTQESQGKFS